MLVVNGCCMVRKCAKIILFIIYPKYLLSNSISAIYNIKITEIVLSQL